MSAIPLNDNDTPLGVVAFQMVRNLPSVSAGDLKLLLAHVIGDLAEREGLHEAANVVSNVLRAARATTTPMSLHEIAFFVGVKHGVTPQQLRLPSNTPGARYDSVVVPRHEAFWLARQQFRTDGTHRFSLPKIGHFFGGRDHATVIFGINQHRARLLKEPI